MDSHLCFGLIVVCFLGGITAWNLLWLRHLSRRGRTAMEQAGYVVQLDPVPALRCSTFSPRHDRYSGAGAISVGSDHMLFHRFGGGMEAIPISAILSIATGHMWFRTWGAGRYGLAMIVNCRIDQNYRILVFKSHDISEVSDYLQKHCGIWPQVIPRGYRVFNSRLITS
jgi:hypothetical protein